MADPFTVDCGGSTRLKVIALDHPPVKLDTLLDDGNTADLRALYTQVTITFIDAKGETKTLPAVPLDGQDVLIESIGDQRTKVCNSGKTSQVQLFGVNGDEPVVEAKQAKGQGRRYVVSNAGAINSVTIGDCNVAYRLSTGFTDDGVPNGAVTDRNQLPAVYTSVTFT
jgi:hypothetical protein